MDGNDLVHRAKERDPEQEIVVVTGVVDVKTAVDAMKLGASEYLIKPFDRTTLTRSLEKILQSRRLRTEHARLLAENIEYMGEQSMFERAASLYSCLAVDPLAARIAEALCVGTRAQSATVWISDDLRPDRLHLAAVRGLVAVNEDPAVVNLDEIPEALQDGSCASVLCACDDFAGEERPALYFALRQDGRVAGLVRLTDKLGHDEFDAVDRAWGDRFLEFAEVALANARRFARLEERTLADPHTGAYSIEYFEGVVRREIEKSNRFGHNFSILSVFCPAGNESRTGNTDGNPGSAMATVVSRLNDVMRSADLLGTDGSGHFMVLLPETDALGAAVFKRRVAELLEAEPVSESADVTSPICVDLALATYPGDGTQLESLLRVLEARSAEHRSSPVRHLGLAGLSLASALAALGETGTEEEPAVADSIVRFLLAEVARRPSDRGVLILSPGAGLWSATAEGLAALSDDSPRTAILVVCDRPRPETLPTAVRWLAPPAGTQLPPFVLRYGDGAVYALIRDEKSGDDGPRMFHTRDRSVVEFLIFRLQREFALPELF